MSRAVTVTSTKGRGCDTKRAHATRGAAMQDLKALVRRGANGDLLNVYSCRHCGSYHVGHKPGTGRKR